MFTETLMNIGTGVVRSAERHSPEICLGAGIVSMVAATVFACKGTIKAKQSIEKAKEDFDIIEKTEETGTTYDDDNQPIEYTHQDAVKDHMIVIANTGMDLLRQYGPAVILTVAGIGLLLKGHNILQKRNVALLAAYEGISKAYRTYQDKVKNVLGENLAYELKHSIEEKEIETETGKKNKDGTPKTKKEKISVIGDVSGLSPYSRIYDSCCPSWDNNAEYNRTVLQGRQSFWNDVLKSRPDHTVFLNEVYKDLGFQPTAAGQVVGWSLNHDKGDGYIDFGIYNMAYTVNRDFVNGFEPCCLLDFNVDDTPVIGCIPKYGDVEVDDDGSIRA